MHPSMMYVFISRSTAHKNKNNRKHKKMRKLDGQGKARREAARRRNFECKINLNSRNYSRSNGSRPTALQRAVIGRRRGALVAAPCRRPVIGKEGVSEGDSI